MAPTTILRMISCRSMARLNCETDHTYRQEKKKFCGPHDENIAFRFKGDMILYSEVSQHRMQASGEDETCNGAVVCFDGWNRQWGLDSDYNISWSGSYGSDVLSKVLN
jgi:hypothetical protein